MKRKVLIADDAPDIRDLLQHILLRCGYQCVTAADGDQAVAAYDTAVAGGEPFDCILLDMKMPGLSGCQVAEHIQERRKDKETPILLVTANGHEPETRACAAKLGKDRLLIKPDDVLCLPSKVTQAIAHREAKGYVAFPQQARRGQF